MAGLTHGIDTPQRVGRLYSLPVEADAKIYQGAIVCINAAGNAVPAANLANLTARGRAEHFVDNTGGAAGDEVIQVLEGEYLLDTDGTIAYAHIGNKAKMIDDHSVGIAGGSDAGVITDIEDDGVWVRVGV